MKKQHWLVLTAVALMSLLCAGSVGAETVANDVRVETKTYTLEPFYPPMMTADAFSAASEVASDESIEPVTYEETVLLMREALLKREAQYNLCFLTTNDEVEEQLQGLFDNVLAHGADPAGGDYLSFMTNIKTSEEGFTIEGMMDGSVCVTGTVIMDYYSTAEQEACVDAKVDELVNEWKSQDLTEYQTICAIYDYICENVEYDYDHLNDISYKPQFTAYAALIEGKAVCQGYASLFYRLAMEMGIDTRIIGGWSNGQGHAWNIVKLGSYYYYNLDSTWDAGNETYSYFLKGESTFEDTHIPDESSHVNYVELLAGYPIRKMDYDPDSPIIIYGDVSGDGFLDDMDVVLMKKYFAGWNVEINKEALDFNNDGEANRKDAMYLARYRAGWPEYDLKY